MGCIARSGGFLVFIEGRAPFLLFTSLLFTSLGVTLGATICVTIDVAHGAAVIVALGKFGFFVKVKPY
jgi:hypothetical protein